MKQSNPWHSPLALLIGTGALLGLTNNLVKIATTGGWQPVTFLLWSLLGAGVLLVGLAMASQARPPLGRAQLRYYMVSGLISISLPNAVMFSAIPHVGAGYASLCLAFPPLLTYGLAVLLKLERLRGLRLLGVVLGLFGSLLLAIGKASAGDAPLGWVLAVLVVPVFLALGNIYRTLRWPAGATPLALAPGMLLAGALLLVPSLAMQGLANTDAVGTSRQPDLWPVLAQMLLFACTYAMFFRLQKIAGPVYLSQIGSVGAMAGAAVAILLLGESGNLSMLLAAVCVVIGVVLMSRPDRSPSAQEAT
ncbi:DMT family transporter [Stutzerimonas urumqiensis]|uniref:EamA family transporter n=1 Tax=Stutzerimonas urumqiensis TaxID=638269 RepID=UPI003DA405F9